MKTNLNGIQKGMITMIDIKGLSNAEVLHASMEKEGVK